MTDLDEDFGPTLWVVNTIFIVLAIFAVAGRFAARRMRKMPLGADDWLICVALFWDCLLYGVFIGCRINGLGKHRATLPPAKVAVFSELLYFFQIIYVLGPPSVKLSLLFLYRRIFEHSRFLLLVYGMMGLIMVWAIIMTFLSIFNCRPISAFWTMEGTCFNFRQFAVGYAIVNIITDFAVWLMPIPSVWKIQLPRAQKFALSLIFALGLFDCAAAMARLLLSMLVLGEYDSTWLYAKGYMWSIIEVSTGIVCTCLPTMRIFVKTAFGGQFARLFGMSSGKASHQQSNTPVWSRNHDCYNELRVSRNKESPKSESDSTHRILVTEEVNVEMHPIRKDPV
ncbi:hypothetical protein N7532_009565 [Penicillium argentinense]|uniref:Rhodopsin domain-containing protein n=1 Tax=Penicillium argentinense TaxID=1131581 RepID=A0A9W9EZQ4_9EURO|nr:uncharacterized protein N7532_009565 [Penicillium argentinense]KAJ5090881.1 hypothetical protein N7532_009565 [Penicillium argentinense]